MVSAVGASARLAEAHLRQIAIGLRTHARS